MTEATIRNRLADFCKSGDIRKVKAIYTMIEDEIAEANNWDVAFIKETERREQSFLDGSAKTYSLEEARQTGRNKVKKNAK